jgi:hypothetical protein
VLVLVRKVAELAVNVLLLHHILISVDVEEVLGVVLLFKQKMLTKGLVDLIIVGSSTIHFKELRLSRVHRILEEVLVLWMVRMLHVLNVIFF